MAIIHTERNIVYAYDPMPDDVLVQTGWFVPIGDKHMRPIYLPYEPITSYGASVKWAKGIADEMAFPIHVLPLNHSDMLNTERWEPYRLFLANLSEAEQRKMHQLLVEAWVALMRDCNDPNLRDVAFENLKTLGVVSNTQSAGA